MALLFMDGFDKYGTTNGATTSPAGILRTRYQQRQDRVYTYTGRHSGYAIVSYWNNESWLQTTVPTTDDTLIIGFSMYCPDPHNAGEIFQLRSENNYHNEEQGGFSIRVNADRSLTVYRETTSLASSAAGVIPLDDWCYFEMKVVCDNTTGSYEVRIDGADVLSNTGVDTQSDTDNFYNVVRFNGWLASVSPSLGMRIDDFWVCDSTGSSSLNSFLGPGIKVTTLSPDSDGDLTDWTPSTGNTHYNLVDEDVQVDTNYVEDTSVDNTDLYNYGDLPDIYSLKAVQVVTEAKTTEPNEWTLKTVVKHNPTVDSDAGQMVGSSDWLGVTRTMVTNPVTATNWTVADVNNLQTGMKVG